MKYKGFEIYMPKGERLNALGVINHCLSKVDGFNITRIQIASSSKFKKQLEVELEETMNLMVEQLKTLNGIKVTFVKNGKFSFRFFQGKEQVLSFM